MSASLQRFELVEELGSGGMGTVYRARDPKLERDVAIKVLSRPEHAIASELPTRDTLDLRTAAPPSHDLLSEARMMARLSHPNVLPIYEVGVDGDRVFLVMEYVAGGSLRAWLEQPRSERDIRVMFAQAAHGLAAAHACGIIHRDFKADNVLVGADGRARVADFGIAGLNAPQTLERGSDGRGTPRYMAPELWKGEPATAASDVFALCRALADALGGADDPDLMRADPSLRDVILAGLADEPATRPHLDRVITALERRPARRWPLLAVGVAVLATIPIAFTLAHHDDTCADEPAFVGARWNAFTRETLRAALAQSHSFEAAKRIPHVVAGYDALARGIADRGRTACEARRRGELTQAQLAVRSACLERRAFELAARVRLELARQPVDLSDAEEAVQLVPTPASCDDIVAPPLADDRGAVEALWDRWVQINLLAQAKRAAAEDALAGEAGRLHESELEARVTISLAATLRNQQDLAASDKAAQRAYRIAADISDADLQAYALEERSQTLALRPDKGDIAVAHDLARQALALASRPTTRTYTRVSIHSALGFAARVRGDDREAADMLEAALGEVSRADPPLVRTELALWRELALAMSEIDGRKDAALANARLAAERARRLVGEDDLDYADSLNIVAYVLLGTGELDEVLRLRRQALAIYRANRDRVSELNELSDIAYVEYGKGDFEQARTELAALVEPFTREQGVRMGLGTVLTNLGDATFASGHYDEGIALLERALDEHVNQFGNEAWRTNDVRVRLANALLERGRIADARRQLEAALKGFETHADSQASEIADVRGFALARVALAEGNPREAEASSRAALAALAELKSTDDLRAEVSYALGASLAAQGRWSDAEPVLADAIALATRSKARADELALIHIEQARVALGLGRRGDAVALAREAREVLERFPGQLRARAQLATLPAR